MAEIVIDIAGNTSDRISRYDGQSFDYVTTLCGDANEKCPLFFGGVNRLHMGFADPPKATGTEEEVMQVYRRVRDRSGQKCGEFYETELSMQGQDSSGAGLTVCSMDSAVRIK